MKSERGYELHLEENGKYWIRAERLGMKLVVTLETLFVALARYVGQRCETCFV